MADFGKGEKGVKIIWSSGGFDTFWFQDHRKLEAKLREARRNRKAARVEMVSR